MKKRDCFILLLVVLLLIIFLMLLITLLIVKINKVSENDIELSPPHLEENPVEWFKHLFNKLGRIRPIVGSGVSNSCENSDEGVGCGKG